MQAASPYPSTAVISGLPGTITEVDVYVTISHKRPTDVDLALVGPHGQTVMLMSDAGSDYSAVSNAALLFKDSAASSLTTATFGSGTYKPTDLPGTSQNPPCNPDRFPAPGPVSWAAALSAFNGTDPNGTWSLYVVDDCGFSDSGSISAWEVYVVTSGNDDLASGSPISIGAAPLVAGPNLVQNPGFESSCFGASDPCNWFARYGYATITRDTTMAHAGSASLLVSGSGAGGGAPQYASGDCVSGIVPGAEYNMYAWYATLDLADFFELVYFYSTNDCDDSSYVGSLAVEVATYRDGGWHSWGIQGTAPAGAASAFVTVGFDCYAPSCAGHADDVNLIRQTPTAVTATRFVARHRQRGVHLSWRIAAASRLVGFNLYRGAAKLNRRLIPASFDGTRDRSYSYVDWTAGGSRTALYSLMGVYLDGRHAWLGTAAA